MKITGVMVQYYTVCKTELWYFSNNINLNPENEYVKLGKIIHEETFSRKKKNLLIDNTIAVDFLEKQSGPIIFEVKKSSKLEEPVRNQILYYLWYLKTKKGIETMGIITYPKEKKREKVFLTEKEEDRIEEIVKEIPKIVSRSRPPKPEKKPYCKKCSYFQLCWC